MAEYFYSHFDRVYFSETEFSHFCRALQIEGKQFNRYEWNFLREQSGYKRRLFSESFVSEERQKLEQFRQHVRRLMQMYIQQGVQIDL